MTMPARSRCGRHASPAVGVMPAAMSRALGPWQALHFDVNAPRTEPDWLAEGLIARGTVTILSGDTSSAKSFVSLALAMAVLEGNRTWLGRPVKGPGRVLMVEGE